MHVETTRRTRPTPADASAEPKVPSLVRDLGQLLGQGTIAIDGSGEILWMNDVALHMHGLRWRSLRNIAEYDAQFSLRNPTDLMAERSPFLRVLEGETLPATDYLVLPKSGREAWRCRIRGKPTWDEGGAVSGGIVVIEDVTDEHQSDEQRKALLVRERLARTAAERERDFIQKIFEAAPMPVVVFEGTEHRVAFLNNAAADLTGLSQHQGRTHAEALPRDHAQIQPLLEAVLRGAAAHARVELEYELPTGVLTLQSHYVPLPGPEKRPIGVVWLAMDITARRRAERALESARRQLSRSERLSALGALVSGVAHELRTPLVYIMNNIFLVRRRLESDPTANRSSLLPHLDEALAGADRIQRIVGELRRFGPLEPRPSAAPLETIVRPAVDLFRATHVGSVDVVADLQPTPHVHVDAYQMQQVVLNLLQNAAEAMPDGGTIRVRTESAPGRARLVVADNGPGIPEAAHAHVFDEFFTTKEGGTGLGLSIVRRIVRHHKGKLTFDTGATGTTFTVDLPVVDAADT